MPLLEPWQWALVTSAAFLIGMSKTGITGIGVVALALFALILPARESVGAILPLLILGDVMAVTIYRRNAVWPHVVRLFPWAAIGVILGYFAVSVINNRQVSVLIGITLIVIVILQWWRTRNNVVDAEDVPHHTWFIVLVGILAGFSTMVANAAGPIMTLYLLAMRLPKMEFVGTTAWFFMLINWFKVPFSANLGLINPGSLGLDLALAPAVILGAAAGRAALPYINQRLFENIALVFALLAGIKLLF
jgi:uncharacterized membrane protein YfcA